MTHDTPDLSKAHQTPPDRRKVQRVRWAGARLLSGVLWALVAIVVLLVVAVAGVLVLLSTDGGRTWAGRTALSLVNDPGTLEIRVDRFTGTGPFHFILEGVSVTDPGGVWLEAERVELDLDPAALSELRVRVETLALERPTLHRMPDYPPGPPEPPEPISFPALPSAPLAITLDRLAVRALSIDESIAGEAAQIDLEARGRWDASGLILVLNGRETTREDGLSIGATLAQVRVDDTLTADIDIRDRAGGLVASLIGRKDLGALSLTARASGNGRDWSGRLDADAAQFGRLSLTGNGGWAGGRAIDIALSVEAGADWPADLVANLGETVRLTTKLDFPDVAQEGTPIRLSDIALRAGHLNLDGDVLVVQTPQAIGGARVNGQVRMALNDLMAAARQDKSGVTLEDGALKLDVSGDFGAPELALRAEAIGVESDSVAARRVEIDLRTALATANDAPVNAMVTGTVEGLDLKALGETPWPYGDRADLAAGLVFNSRTGQLEITEATLMLDGAHLDVAGAFNTKSQAGEAEISLGAERLAIFAPDALTAARAEISLTAARTEASSPVTGRLRVGARDLGFKDESLGGLVGKSADLAFDFSAAESRALSVRDLTLLTASGVVNGTGQAAFNPSEDSLSGGLKLDIPQAAPLSALAGLPLEGPVRAEVTVSGSPASPIVNVTTFSPLLTAGSQPFEQLSLKAAYDTSGEVPGVSADLAFLTPGRAEGSAPVEHTLDAEVALTPGVPRINRLTADLFGLTITQGKKQGQIDLVSRDLRELGRHINAITSGRAPAFAGGTLEGTLDITGPYGLTLKGDKWLIAQPGANPVMLKGLRLTATADPGAEGALDVDLLLEDLRAGEFVIRKAEATVDGTTAAPEFALVIKDPDKNGLRVDLAGSLSPQEDGGQVLELPKADIRFREAVFALAEPVRVALGAQGEIDARLVLGLTDTDTGNAGTISTRFQQDVRGMLAELSLAGVPLRLAGLVPGTPRVPGRVEGDIRFSTFREDTGATARVALVGIGHGWAAEEPRFDIAGGWDGAAATLSGRLTKQETTPLSLDIAVPLVNVDGAPALPDGARIDGTLNADGDVGEIWDYLPLPDHLLKGPMTADLKITGPVDAPDVSGTIALADGRYDNLQTGMTLRKLSLLAQAEDGGLTYRLTARDDGEGTLTGKGTISLQDRGFSIDTGIVLKDLGVMRRDDLTAVAGGEVRIAGTNSTGIDVTGKINVKKADIRIPDQLPPEVVDLETVNMAGDGFEIEEPEEPTKKPSPLPVRLSIDVRADETITIEGRGLESRWGGDLEIRGQATQPRVAGRITIVRGMLDFLGRDFRLTRGEVIFDGGREIEPRLNIVAERTDNDITAIVTISGTGSNPELDLSSEPAMSKDQVLAQMLFGKSISELTTFELLSIAQGVATLSGQGGLGLLGKAKDTLGIDVLEVDADGESENIAESVTVTVGKRISDDIYVGVKQGVTAGSSAVTLEVQLTERLLLHTDVAQNSDSTVGVRWKWDY